MGDLFFRSSQGSGNQHSQNKIKTRGNHQENITRNKNSNDNSRYSRSKLADNSKHSRETIMLQDYNFGDFIQLPSDLRFGKHLLCPKSSVLALGLKPKKSAMTIDSTGISG